SARSVAVGLACRPQADTVLAGPHGGMAVCRADAGYRRLSGAPEKGGAGRRAARDPLAARNGPGQGLRCRNSSTQEGKWRAGRVNALILRVRAFTHPARLL